MPINPNGFLLNFSSNPVTKVLKIEPKKLIKKAVNPRVNPTKSDFKTATNIADGIPNAPATDMLATFEIPSFAPGGKKGSAGSKLSNIDKTIAAAVNTATIESLSTPKLIFIWLE